VTLAAALPLAAACGGSPAKSTGSPAARHGQSPAARHGQSPAARHGQSPAARHGQSPAATTPTQSGSHTASTPSSATPAAPGGPQTATSGMGGPALVSASAGGLSASMHASSHHPTVNRPWPLSFTVTRAGRPALASVSYEYLFAGQVVARRDHYAFTGRFSDVFVWPAAAVGYPLTFRAVIVSAATTIDLDYAVQVGT